GRFRFDGVEPGSYKLSAESIEEGALSGARPVEIGSSGIEDLVIEMDLAASIAGLVVDTDGAPLRGLQVFASFFLGNDSGQDRTAADGSFHVRTLTGGGSYELEVVGPSVGSVGYKPAVPGGRFPPVAVADGNAHVTGVRLVMRRGDLTLSGR